MKKRILSLALALVMLFSLVLMSCDNEEESSSSESAAPVVTPEPEPEIPVEDFIDNITLTDKKVGASTYLTNDIGEADYIGSYNSHFIYYTVDEISTEDNVTVLSRTHNYVSVYTGTKISYKEDLAKTSEDADYNTTITDVTVNAHDFKGEFLVVTVTYGTFAEGESGTKDVILYNRLGAKVAERKFTAYDKYDLMISEDNEINKTLSLSLPFICFDGIVYFIEDDCTLTKAYDAHKSMIVPSELSYNEKLGSFTYQQEENGVINYTVLDKTLTALKSIRFEYNTEADDTDFIILNNYNLLFTETVLLTDDSEEWDIYLDGKKRNVTTYLINAETSEKTELDIDFIPNFLVASTEYEVTDKSLNIISYYEIDGKEVISKVNYAVIDNDGKIVKYLNPIIGNSLTVTQNGMKIVSTEFGSYYIDNDGKIIRRVFDNVVYNNLWAIVDNTRVYDASCNLIYEIPEDYSIVNINNNSILLSKAVETVETVVADDPETTDIDETQTETRFSTDYYLFKGKDSVTLLFNTPQLSPTTGAVSSLYNYNDNYYMVRVRNLDTSEVVYKIYDDLGTERATLDKDCEIIDYASGEYGLNLLVKKTVTTEVEGENPVTTVTYHLYSLVLPQ